MLINCDYWSFVCCNTRCQAFYNNNNNLPIPINLQLSLISTYYFALFAQKSKCKNLITNWLWLLIICMLYNTSCQAFNKNNNNLPIRISLQLGVNTYLLFCNFLGLFPHFFCTSQISRNVFLHKNESAEVWILLANCNYGSFVHCNTRCQTLQL